MHRVAGMLNFFAGMVLLLGILTAEIFYPVEYSISQNMISNLGSTPYPSSIVRQPSADIFDYSLIITGTFLIISVGILHKMKFQKIFLISLFFLGLGTFGVGIFPAFHRYAHSVTALIAFLAGGVAAITSMKITKPPFSVISSMLGIISLVFLFLGLIIPQSIVPILGRGGTERWVMYPILIWLIGFGGYLMNSKK